LRLRVLATPATTRLSEASNISYRYLFSGVRSSSSLVPPVDSKDIRFFEDIVQPSFLNTLTDDAPSPGPQVALSLHGLFILAHPCPSWSLTEIIKFKFFS
jgi:hypothetical protein